MTKLVTNFSLFAKRGDPWITDREGREKFGRNLSSENPDMDQWTRAGFARRGLGPNVGGVEITKAKAMEKPVDVSRIRANRRLRLKNGLAACEEAARVRLHLADEKERRDRVAAECDEEEGIHAETHVPLG